MNTTATWRPRRPSDAVLKVCRNEDDGSERIVWLGLIESVTPDGDVARVQGTTVESLVADMPLPFLPPGTSQATDREGFEYWWRQLLYIFELPDPRLFPPLESSLAQENRQVVDRFVGLTQQLAASGVANAFCSVQVSHNRETDEMTVVPTFPALDLQAGFTALLRQCESHEEPASYDKVRDILWLASEAATDSHRVERLDQIRMWHAAVKALRKKSVNQLLRERLIANEGFQVLAYDEERTPADLLRTFNYGDLIHWGTRRDEIAAAQDELGTAQLRFDFLEGALGLAHAVVGVGELVRAAVTPRDQLLLP
jgi:hypothetical protein